MTTNKPKVVAWLYERTKLGNMFEDEPNEGFWFVPETEDGPRSYIKGQPVIRLSDYEALQAECEKLRNLLRHAQPIIKAHAEASHMLEGFRPRRNQWDELVEGIDAAIQEENRGR